MHRVTDSGAAAQRSALKVAVAVALAATLTGIAWWALASAPTPAAALAIVALSAGLAGHALARARADARLRTAREQARLLGQLVDAWQWRTDAEHRLVHWQPPADAGAAAWPEADAAQPLLWERFEAEAGSLQARLQAQVPVLDLPVRRRDGSARWTLRALPHHDASGRFAGYWGSARALDDELERRADQAALEAVLEAVPGAVWIGERDAAGAWRVRRCNDAAAQRLGAAAGGTPWERVFEALPPGLNAATLAPGGSASAGGWTVRLGAGAAAGGPRVLVLLRDGDDGAVGAAEHAQFSYTVSHDLRAPLRVVEGFTRIVKEDYARVLDRIGIDHLDRVLAAAARMHSMIDALLALAHLTTQPLARQPVNLSQLAGYVVDELKRQAPERPVDVRIDPGLEVEGDPTLLRVALENLLGNAWKYSARTPAPRIGFGTVDQGGRRVFVVRDNGAGFDMRFADRLFCVFQRLHSANDFQGTGVGLASVRRIVRRHGGDVWAESEVGRGARFYFTIGG